VAFMKKYIGILFLSLLFNSSNSIQAQIIGVYYVVDSKFDILAIRDDDSYVIYDIREDCEERTKRWSIDDQGSWYIKKSKLCLSQNHKKIDCYNYRADKDSLIIDYGSFSDRLKRIL
tara:strand:- start:1255 stop:1605 length:351 start_codon:yes stop_codon:yes gene_type:complete